MIVVAAVIQNNGLYLACRRAPHKALPGKWEFPGGKVEAGESEQEALAREILEELQVKIAVGDFIVESTLGDITMRTYLATLKSSSPASSSDHDAFEWLAVEQLDSLDWAELDIPVVEALRA